MKFLPVLQVIPATYHLYLLFATWSSGVPLCLYIIPSCTFLTSILPMPHLGPQPKKKINTPGDSMLRWHSKKRRWKLMRHIIEYLIKKINLKIFSFIHICLIFYLPHVPQALMGWTERTPAGLSVFTDDAAPFD